MRSAASLDGMARALLHRGVTSFLPTAVTAPLDDLRAFADRVRAWMPGAPEDGSAPLGFNLEGPFVSPQRVGAQNPAFVRAAAEIAFADLEPIVDGFRLTTIAPGTRPAHAPPRTCSTRCRGSTSTRRALPPWRSRGTTSTPSSSPTATTW